MTANWAAIRRRLAVGRAANRPPWRGRQAGHGSIVAPLAATLAATVAVGVGVALAQSERTRRSAKLLRKRERRFTQLPGEPLGEALRRMALGQLDIAIELLAGKGNGEIRRGKKHGKGRQRQSKRKAEQRGHSDTLDARAIHDTRKALKRLRALVRLLREELGEEQFRREHELLRDAARRLAGARDAQVMVGTLDALLERRPHKLGRRRPLIDLRKRLLSERAAAARRALGEATRVEVLEELEGLRERARRWTLPERAGIAVVENDLRRVYRQGRRRYKHLTADRRSVPRRGERGGERRGKRRGKGSWEGNGKRREKRRGARRGKSDTRALHEWRKAVKDLRYAAEMLGLRPLARRTDTLAELLGEEHDLALLAARLPPPGRAPFQGKRGKRARKALLEQIARRRRRLRKRALREGERLYRRKPKKFARRARRAHPRG